MARIFLILNDPLIAARMRAAIDASPDLETCGWVATLDQARVPLAQTRPDLVLADLQLADGPFASLLDPLCHSGRYGRPKAMVLAPAPEHPHLLAALRHGADGYALRGRPAESLIAALHQVLRGESQMAAAIALRVKEHFAAPVAGLADSIGDAQNPLNLSGLERRILDGLASGYAPEDVCQALCIGAQDLGLQLRSIYRKLQFDLHAGTLTLKAA